VRGVSLIHQLRGGGYKSQVDDFSFEEISQKRPNGIENMGFLLQNSFEESESSNFGRWGW